MRRKNGACWAPLKSSVAKKYLDCGVCVKGMGGDRARLGMAASIWISHAE